MWHSSLRTTRLRLVSASVLVTILPTRALHAQVSFDADRVYPLEGSGGAVAVGDVNRDGFLDMCVAPASNDPTSMAILLGDGSGRFRQARLTPTGFIRPTVLRFVDANLDGNLDLVTVDETQGTFGVLVGNGRGKFTASASFALHEVVTNTLFGDFDGDGLVDIAFHLRANHQVVMWRGNVEHLLVPGGIVALPWHSAMVAAADFDGDGDLDLVISVPEYQGYLQLLLNDGAANFAPHAGVAVSPYPEVLATGDINGDGALDVVVAHNGVSQIWLLYGDGRGRLNFGQIFVGIAIRISIQDLDGDGNPEILAVVPDGVIVFHARGGGTYDYGIFVAGGGNRGVAVGDFDGDGDQDLVLETGYPRVHRSRLGEQTGQAEIQVRELAGAEMSVELDGDDFLDLVTADARAGTIVVRHGTAGGGFGPSTVYTGATSSDHAFLLSADVDGDNRQDVVLATSPISPTGVAAATVALNDGVGGLVVGPSLTYTGPVIGVGILDVSGDRVPDLAIGHGYWLNASNPGYVDFYEGNGDGTFSSSGRLALPSAAAALAFGDWNDDGRTDMAYRDSVRRIPAETRIHSLLHTSTGFVDVSGPTFPIGEFFDLMTPADVNGDGHADWVLSGGQIGLRVAFGDGAANFDVQPILDDDTSTVAVSVADFDGNGTPDIAALSGRFYRVGVFLGEDGEFNQAPLYFGTGYRPTHMVAGDFNRDGRLDLAAVCTGEVSPALDLLMNDTPALLERTRLGRVNAGMGTTASVLCVNGTPGDARGGVSIDRSHSFRVQIDASPAGPPVARYALYAWLGESSDATLSPLPLRLGSSVFPTPIAGGRPAFIWNNLGARYALGFASIPSPPAPTTALRIPSGLQRSAVFTLQGLVQDNGSAASRPISLTNAVTVSQP